MVQCVGAERMRDVGTALQIVFGIGAQRLCPLAGVGRRIDTGVAEVACLEPLKPRQDGACGPLECPRKRARRC